jgi:hypothetical protein
MKCKSTLDGAIGSPAARSNSAEPCRNTSSYRGAGRGATCRALRLDSRRRISARAACNTAVRSIDHEQVLRNGVLTLPPGYCIM